MPRVLNKKIHGCPPDAIYIGRPSRWGNPFIVGKHGSREEVVERYARWLCDKPDLIAALPELYGRDLVCWCAPLACHGDVLLAIVNG